MTNVFKFITFISELPRWQKRTIVFVIDFVLLLQSIWIAFSLRLGQWLFWSEGIAKFALVAAILAPAILAFFGIYNAIFRFAGLGMMRTLMHATVVYGLVVASIFTVYGFIGVPRTVGIIQPLIFFLLVASARVLAGWLIVAWPGRELTVGAPRKGLIYGVNDAGRELANSIRANPEMRFVGFIDDDDQLDRQRLDNHKIFSSNRLDEVIADYGVTDVLLALPEASRARKREIIESLRRFKVAVKTLPRMSDIWTGKVSISDVRPIKIEDLLGRDPVLPHEHLVTRTIAGKTVLVTGAGGSIGSELCRQIVEAGADKLILFEISEASLYTIEQELSELIRSTGRSTDMVAVLGSITDAALVNDIVRQYTPDTVYHAAAYKHVPLVERNARVAVINNVLGTLTVVESCVDAGVSDFILVSTDKAVRPTNVMGATKRCAELIVQAFAECTDTTTLSMVRFGNVLGSSGSVVPLFKRQIASGGPITLTDSRITRYFMTIPEAANLVIQAAGMAKGGEVFVLDMGEPIKIVELARTMIELSGLSVRDEDTPDGDIEIKEVGLREAEKLYEELLIGGKAEDTIHSRILRSREHFMPLSKLRPALQILYGTKCENDTLGVLKKLVPDFDHRRDNDTSTAPT